MLTRTCCVSAQPQELLVWSVRAAVTGTQGLLVEVIRERLLQYLAPKVSTESWGSTEHGQGFRVGGEQGL